MPDEKNYIFSFDFPPSSSEISSSLVCRRGLLPPLQQQMPQETAKNELDGYALVQSSQQSTTIITPEDQDHCDTDRLYQGLVGG